MRRVRVAAVFEDVVAVAAGILQGIRQNGHRGEVPALVHLTSESESGVGVPLREEGDGTERERPDDLTEEVAMRGALSRVRRGPVRVIEPAYRFRHRMGR